VDEEKSVGTRIWSIGARSATTVGRPGVAGPLGFCDPRSWRARGAPGAMEHGMRFWTAVAVTGVLVGCGADEPVGGGDAGAADAHAADAGVDAAREVGDDGRGTDATEDADADTEADTRDGAASDVAVSDVAVETGPTDAGADVDVGEEVSPPHPPDFVPDVPLAGPYGERTFRLEAGTNWASTGLYLRAGQRASIDAEGEWFLGDRAVGPGGDPSLGRERDCPLGSLAARVGLAFEGPITCVGPAGELVADTDGVLYAAMLVSNDLGEAYGTRLDAAGSLTVTVRSEGDTAPAIAVADLEETDLSAIASGVLEVLGRHTSVEVSAATVERDRVTVVDAMATLDTIWEHHATLRGMAPMRGQRIRFVADTAIEELGAYMLASNPVRCVPALLDGTPQQRILRAAEPDVDIWGFAHELGHIFSFANGTWVFQYNNVEVFPNIFTLYTLEQMGRTENQPNYATYCDRRDSWFAEDGAYEELRDDPFLQLCFLMEFTGSWGWEFWTRFYGLIDETPNEAIPIGGTPEHANTWGFLLEAFSEAAGEDVRALFDEWRIPLPEGS
jgi:hypothetical protein